MNKNSPEMSWREVARTTRLVRERAPKIAIGGPLFNDGRVFSFGRRQTVAVFQRTYMGRAKTTDLGVRQLPPERNKLSAILAKTDPAWLPDIALRQRRLTVRSTRVITKNTSPNKA